MHTVVDIVTTNKTIDGAYHAVPNNSIIPMDCSCVYTGVCHCVRPSGWYPTPYRPYTPPVKEYIPYPVPTPYPVVDPAVTEELEGLRKEVKKLRKAIEDK